MLGLVAGEANLSVHVQRSACGSQKAEVRRHADRDPPSSPERALAVYQHACLRYVSNEPTNNTSIRERFGISDRNKAAASRIIREAVDEELVVPYDPAAGPRAMRYVPFWADPDR